MPRRPAARDQAAGRPAGTGGTGGEGAPSGARFAAAPGIARLARPIRLRRLRRLPVRVVTRLAPPLFLSGVQGLHDRLEVAGEDRLGPLEHLPDRVVDEAPLLRAGPIEHVVDRVPAGAGATDAEPHPREVAGPEVGRDVTQPVVPSVAAAFLDPHRPGREIEVVVHHEDRGGRDPVVLRDPPDRLPAPVHVRRRLDEPYPACARRRLAGVEREAPGRPEVRPEACGKPVREPEPRVVPGPFVLRPGVAETDQELRSHRREVPPSPPGRATAPGRLVRLSPLRRRRAPPSRRRAPPLRPPPGRRPARPPLPARPRSRSPATSGC